MNTVSTGNTDEIPIEVKPGYFSFYIWKASGNGTLTLQRRPKDTTETYADVDGMAITVTGGGEATSLSLLIGENESSHFDWQLLPSGVTTSVMYYGYGRQAAMSGANLN